MSELRKIPNVGKQTEQDLIAMGYPTIESLRGKRAEDLYAEECKLRNCTIDRCQLYLYRAVEYFVNTPHPNPHKYKWWHWKDEYTNVSPCGAKCITCDLFPNECKGCRRIKGKVFWLEYTGGDCCPIYDCCVHQKQENHCGRCEELPCIRYQKDPTISDEQNAANLKIMLANLDQATRSQDKDTLHG